MPSDATRTNPPARIEERSQLARDSEVPYRIFQFAPGAKPRPGLLPAACVRARARS